MDTTTAPTEVALRPAAMLQIDFVGALTSLALIGFVSGWSASIWIGTFAFGMSVASMFASCINFAGERIPMTSHGTAVFLVGGSAGSMSLPWLVGRMFEARGPEWMIYIVGAAMVSAILLLSVILARAPDSHDEVARAQEGSL